jgi:hypothetical protein
MDAAIDTRCTIATRSGRALTRVSPVNGSTRSPIGTGSSVAQHCFAMNGASKLSQQATRRTLDSSVTNPLSHSGLSVQLHHIGLLERLARLRYGPNLHHHVLIYKHQFFLLDNSMKSLVLLTFLSLNPDSPPVAGKAEYFDTEASCKVRMQELRTLKQPSSALRCSCHKTIPPVEATGNDAI